MDKEEFEDKVRKAAQNDTYLLRDDNGFLYWVDTVDNSIPDETIGIFYHSDDGDTYRATLNEAYSWFEIVDAETYEAIE